jgi:hypothetical protein
MKKSLIIFFLSGSLFAQGPVDGFMKKKKEFSLGMSFTREKASQLYSGPNLGSGGRTTRALSFFGIYGITDKINVQVGIPYLDVNKGAQKGFQDGSIYLKYNVMTKKNKFGELRAMLAAGYSDPLSQYETNNSSSIGQMALAGDGRLVLHQSFKSNIFATLQGGYLFKSDPTPNAVASSLKIGYAGNIYVDVYYEIIHAIGGTDYRGDGELRPTADRGGFKGLGFGYQKIGGTVYYGLIDHLGVFGGVSYILDGRNAFKNTGLNIGFVFQ